MIAYESVLLPEPFGPITACTWLTSTSRSTPFTISVPSSSATCRFSSFRSPTKSVSFPRICGDFTRTNWTQSSGGVPAVGSARQRAQRILRPFRSPRWKFGRNRLPSGHAEHRNRRDHSSAPLGAAALRRQAAAGGRSLARVGDEGVQGLGHGQEPAGSARAALLGRADGPAPRARTRLRAHEEVAPPPWSRRGGDAGRASRGAASAHLRVPRRAARRLHRDLRDPPAPAALAEPAAAGARRQADHAERRRAVPHRDEDQPLRGPDTRGARDPLAVLGLLRSRRRRAPRATRPLLRFLRRRPARGRDRLRL